MVGKYQAYPEYKDCSFPLIKQIPNNWSEQKVKFQLSDCVAGGTPESGNELFWTESGDGTPWVSIADMTRSTLITRTEKDVTDRGIYSKGLKIVPKGSLLYSIFASLGKVSEAGVDLTTNQAILALIQKETLNKAFFRYWLQSMERYLMYYSTSNTQNNLNSEKVGNLPIFIPSHFEQVNIGCFLDHETVKIDTLIDKQQQLIQLLKEKRQAVISHAVTKGLNPNAPMRDSGVEWLGKVPQHWSVVPIKRVCEVKDGTHDTPQYVDPSDEAFPLITSKDFDGNNISFENAKYISKADYLEIIKRSNTEVGDVLMSMIGGNIGKALIVKNHANFSIKNVALFKAGECEYLAKYILYYLQSGLLDVQILLLSRGGAQGFLSLGDLRNLVFFKIPECELKGIVTTLNRQVVKFDDLIVKAQSVIQFMQERRTALISAAVTGKIDVRHHVSHPASSL